MRIKFLILACLATFVAALAIPTMPGIWRMAKLANGTQIRLEQVGDENLHYWRDARGICYNVDDNGVATPIANMQAVRAHAATRVAQNNARRSAAATRTVGISHKHVGKRKGLIVLANFTDAHFQPEHTNELLTRMANEVGFTYKEVCTTILKPRVMVSSTLLLMWLDLYNSSIIWLTMAEIPSTGEARAPISGREQWWPRPVKPLSAK